MQIQPLENIKLSFKCPKQLNELQACNGDWYCDGCQKIVYDFRGMSEAQVLTSLVKNDYKMCGLFEAGRIEILPQKKWFRWAAAAMLFLGLTSCHDDVLGQARPTHLDTITKQQGFIMGKVVMPHPTFPGGTEAFNKYLQKNLKLKKGITGEVLAEVTLENEGKVTGVKIIKGADWALNQQIMDVLQFSPKWTGTYGKSTALVHINLAEISR